MKAAVGLCGLLVPLVWTVIEMIALAQITRLGRLGLTLTLLVIFYSFAENLEIPAYFIWPGLLLIGCAFRRCVSVVATASHVAPEPMPQGEPA